MTQEWLGDSAAVALAQEHIQAREATMEKTNPLMSAENKAIALSEVASLSVKRTDMRFSEHNRALMRKRIEELVARWHFTGQEVYDQLRKQSS